MWQLRWNQSSFEPNMQKRLIWNISCHFELCGRIIGQLATVIIIVLAVVLMAGCGRCCGGVVAVVCVLFVQVVGCAIGSIRLRRICTYLSFQGVADLCGQPFRLSCAQSNPASPQQIHTPPPPSPPKSVSWKLTRHSDNVITFPETNNIRRGLFLTLWSLVSGI